MKEQEMHADIIAEMRGARTEFPFVYLMGEPDTPEVIDFRTKEIVEPRKINIRRVTVTELADRLEAANKRECGDVANLREACANIAEYARSAMCHATDAHLLGYLNQIEGWSKAALATPPRNCDRFATETDAQIAFLREVWLIEVSNLDRDPFDGWTNEMKSAYSKWLFAPATEKEGGAE